MRVVEARVDDDADVDDLLDRLDAVAATHDATIQAFDARYVADRAHIERAVELADRERKRGEGIARSRAVEILLYAAGRRQIDRALEMGVRAGGPAVVVVDGGDESTAVDAVRDCDGLVPESVEWGDPDRLRAFFDVPDAEVDAADGDLSALVRERVALLVVER